MDHWLLLITKTTQILPIFLVLFIWQKLILTHYSTTAITDISPPYEGRASLDIDVAQGKANLKLTSIKMEDNKVFECRVQIPLDDEGKPVDTAKLVVLGNHWLSRDSCVPFSFSILAHYILKFLVVLGRKEVLFLKTLTSHVQFWVLLRF